MVPRLADTCASSWRQTTKIRQNITPSQRVWVADDGRRRPALCAQPLGTPHAGYARGSALTQEIEHPMPVHHQPRPLTAANPWSATAMNLARLLADMPAMPDAACRGLPETFDITADDNPERLQMMRYAGRP